MNVRAATEQDAAGIVALHKASNPFGDWYRNPLQRLGRGPYEDLTPFERYLHRGFAVGLPLLRGDLLWETRAFTADLAKVPRPEDEFTTHFLAADYGDLRGLLLLDHREPARWRFETLTGLWPAAQVAGLPDAMKLVAVTVRPERGAAFAVVAAHREWIDPPLAELDVWMNPANRA